MYASKSSNCTTIASTRLNQPSRQQSTIMSLDYQWCTRTVHYKNGTDSSSTPKTYSICCVPPDQIRASWRTKTYTKSSISTIHQWRLSGPRDWYSSIQMDAQCSAACAECFCCGQGVIALPLTRFFCLESRGYMITGTYRPYPKNYSMPAISEGDRTITAAADLLDACKKIVPANGTTRREYARVIAKLTEILSGSQPPRVGNDHQAPPQSESPINTTQASTSNNTTSPATIRATKQIHQRVTRSNTPMPNPPSLVFNPTADARKLRKCNGEVIGYKKNAAKNATRKRVAKLVEEQTDRDRLLQLKTGISEIITTNVPEADIRVQYHVPTPKGAPAPIPITQDEDEVATPNGIREPRRS